MAFWVAAGSTQAECSWEIWASGFPKGQARFTLESVCLLLLLHELLCLCDTPSFLKQREALAFGGSKPSNCPSCLALPQPWCLWVSKKEFSCCFIVLALSFYTSLRHLLPLPQASCTHAPDSSPGSGLSFIQRRAQQGKWATTFRPLKGNGVGTTPCACPGRQHPSPSYLERGSGTEQLWICFKLHPFSQGRETCCVSVKGTLDGKSSSNHFRSVVFPLVVLTRTSFIIWKLFESIKKQLASKGIH